MRDFTQEELEANRPQIELLEAIEFCLRKLYRDSRHIIEEEFVRGLSFEELIGALLLARDQFEEKE